MFRHLAGITALCLAVVGFVGCGGGDRGPKQFPVKGTVKYKGEALAGATVSFMSDSGHVSTGSTDAQGQYTLMTGGKPGAPAGSYQVGISKVGKMEGVPANPKPEDMIKMMNMKTKKMEQPKSEIPEKYGQPAKSGFTATVTEDATKNVFDFDLTE